MKLAPTLFALALSFSLLAACAGEERPAVAPDGPPASPPAGAAPPGAQPQGGGEGPVVPVGSPGCKYVIPNSENCYVVEAGACKAAGCAPGKCLIAESHPAQVSCAK
ncbi:MAG TPA: hypothetical protein VFS43_12140 [Polyangiaceae bacterium]|nr:hypothetical protein [Polyangiaceae bacterium]